VPAATPVTTPVLPTVAMPVALLLQVPPAVAFDKVLVLPAHNVAVPDMAPGVGSVQFAALIPGIIT
jgi:hypothetical protein